MTCYYLDLGSASDWLKIFLIQSEALQWPRSASDSSSVWNFCPHSWEIDYLKVNAWRCEMSAVFLRLVFTENGVGVRIVIRSVELYELVKTAFWFFSFRLRLLCLRSSESWVITWECALSLVYPSASASDSDNLVFTRSQAERKRRSRKRNWKKMETFWFFWLRFRCAYDSAHVSDFFIFIRS